MALAKPSDRERTQWYFQRYVATCPRPARSFSSTAAGTTAPASSGSWASAAAEVKTFLGQAPTFEKLLVDDGTLLFKYWLTVDQEKQEERFAERLSDPLKRWKLSPIDVQAREKYADYGRARDAMLKATHTKHAPWTLVDFNDQRRGRLTLIRDLLDRIPEHAVPDVPVDLAPLGHPPLKERYRGPVKPIPNV